MSTAAAPARVGEAGRIRSMVDFYLTTMRTAISAQFQYRVSNYFYMLGMVAEPVIYLVVWSTIADQSGGSVQGITAGEFAAYYIVWTLVRNMNIVFAAPAWEWRIREGQLSGWLLRPVQPLHYDIAYFAGMKVVVIALWIPIGVALTMIFNPTFVLTAEKIGVFFVAIWGAYLIRTMFMSALGMVCFWTTRGAAIFDLWMMIELLLSGRLVPLPLMPDWVQTLAMFLPFQWAFYFPIECLAGDLSSVELLRGLGAQVFWILSGSRPSASSGGRHSTVLGGREYDTRLRVTWLFLKVGVLNELQYRVNFFVSLLQSLIQVVTGLVVLALVYSHTTELNGWTQPELLCLLGIQILLGGVIRTFIQPNMNQLMEDVQQGTLDYALTKPEDAQVLVSVRRFQIWQAVDIVSGLILLAVGISDLTTGIGLANVASFLFALVVGTTMIYCFWLVMTTGAFWIVRMENIAELFDGVYFTGRFPTGIYPPWLRFRVTFLVPIAFAVTVPAEAITSRLDWQTMLVAIVFAIVLAGFTRWFWRYGLKNYTGASA